MRRGFFTDDIYVMLSKRKAQDVQDGTRLVGGRIIITGTLTRIDAQGTEKIQCLSDSETVDYLHGKGRV